MKEHIIALIRDLDWQNEASVQSAAIDQLVTIDDNDIGLLIQPFGNKACWENAALVLQKIGYPRIGAVTPALLRWLADLNWPGANVVFELLLSVDNEVLIGNLNNALRMAKAENDFMWIDAMKELLVAKKIEEYFETPEMQEILKLADRA